MQNPSAPPVKICATIHLTLEKFQAMLWRSTCPLPQGDSRKTGRSIRSLFTIIRNGNPGRPVSVGCIFKFFRIICPTWLRLSCELCRTATVTDPEVTKSEFIPVTSAAAITVPATNS